MAIIYWMKNEKTYSLVELASSCPGLMVTIKCTDLIDAFRFMVQETKLQLEQTISDTATETYLTEEMVCQMLDVSHSTLWRWQKSEYLVPVKFGRKNRYKKSQIEALLNQKN
jgi:predicted DNA-binding transcriptional regulator AlpA